MSNSHDKTTQHNCPACSYGPFTRNNYFTGKLLVERDFTDEQRFHIEKLRHHEQRLHGWGVVCGLKVKQHANENCRDRFVCIEPGTAIDCCGHEIVLREEQCLDLTQTAVIKSLKEKNDTGPHTVQICIRYRECPTEEIPVLYDECGCDDTQCAPNRILESYDLDVILDPPKDPDAINAPRLQWENNIALAHSFRVALHDDTSRLYVMSTDGPGSIYQLSTDNHTVLASRPLPAKGKALAVSNDGTRLYVITEANPRKLLVLDTANLAAAPKQTLDIVGSNDSDVYLAVAPQPDGRLFALVAKTGSLKIFGTDINGSGTPANPNVSELGVANLSGLAIGSDAAHAYMGDPNPAKQLLILDIASNTATNATVLPNNTKVSALAVVRSTGPDLLAVADSANKQMHLVGLGPAKLIGSSGALAHEPIDLAVTPGGHWAYLLEKDGSNHGYVQALSAHAMQLAPVGQTVDPGDALAVGDLSQQIVITDSGQHLYIPYTGNLAVATDGGVAILSVDETACGEILWRHLDGCPHCEVANCVVLATIKNYYVDYKVLDQSDPPANPVTDQTEKKARINNRTRRLLPSTQVLTDLVKCLLEHPAAGGAGKQGPVGPTGPTGPTGPQGGDGLGIEQVSATIIPCDQKPADPKIEMINGKRTLELEIPRGCDAELPEPPYLTHISGINWVHGATISSSSKALSKGLLIAFDHPLQGGDINDQSVMVLAQQPGAQRGCWCEVPGTIIRGSFDLVGDVTSVWRPKETTVNGVQFQPGANGLTAGTYRVVVKGDFIRDEVTKRAVDADHLPPWFSKPAEPHKHDYKTGDGVAGGTFESWFTIGSG